MTALLVVVIPMIGACVIAFLLGACWQAGQADEQSERIIERIEADRVIRLGDQHPQNPWLDR